MRHFFVWFCLNQSEKIKEIIKKKHASYFKTVLHYPFNFFLLLCSLLNLASVILRFDYSYVFFLKVLRRPYSLALSSYSLFCTSLSMVLHWPLLSLWSFVFFHCPYSLLLYFCYTCFTVLTVLRFSNGS